MLKRGMSRSVFMKIWLSLLAACGSHHVHSHSLWVGDMATSSARMVSLEKYDLASWTQQHSGTSTDEPKHNPKPSRMIVRNLLEPVHVSSPFDMTFSLLCVHVVLGQNVAGDQLCRSGEGSPMTLCNTFHGTFHKSFCRRWEIMHRTEKPMPKSHVSAID